MLTAIGLCVFVMVMQLMPQISDGGLDRISTNAPAGTRVVAR